MLAAGHAGRGQRDDQPCLAYLHIISFVVQMIMLAAGIRVAVSSREVRLDVKRWQERGGAAGGGLSRGRRRAQAESWPRRQCKTQGTGRFLRHERQ